MNFDNDSSKDFIRQLLELCSKNDRRAQLKLYNLYAKAMYNVCLHIVHQPVTAEDLMQEAFISAFKNLGTYKGEVSFGAWLKKININKCIDFLKQRKVDFETVDKINLPVDSAPDENSFLMEQKVEKIKNEITFMPDGYRTILSLYLFEGYDHEEIAQILNISPSTSRSQYTRAKALLAKRLRGL